MSSDLDINLAEDEIISEICIGGWPAFTPNIRQYCVGKRRAKRIVSEAFAEAYLVGYAHGHGNSTEMSLEAINQAGRGAWELSEAKTTLDALEAAKEDTDDC